jgi:hypothetical protein
VLTVLGINGLVVFIVGSTNPTTGNEQGSSVWQGLSVILGAVLFGVGLVSLVIGTIKRRKFRGD